MGNMASNEHMKKPCCSHCGATKYVLYHINDDLLYLCSECLLEIGIRYANQNPEKFNKGKKGKLYG